MNNLHKNNVNSNEVPIIRKTYELYKLFYKYLELFPKKDKYNLGSRCEIFIIDTLELFLKASCSPKDKKLVIINKASVKFDMLKIFIRIAQEFNLLDQNKYIELQNHLQEIGKMLGGWIKLYKKDK